MFENPRIPTREIEKLPGFFVSNTDKKLRIGIPTPKNPRSRTAIPKATTVFRWKSHPLRVKKLVHMS